MKSPPKNFCCTEEKVLMQKCKVFGLCANCAAQSNFRMTEDSRPRDEGQSFDILKTMIFHGGRIAIHLTCEICRPKCILLIFFFTIFKRKRGGVSIFHFALYYAVFLLDQVLIIKITTQESGLFFLFFITSSIYRFSQKKRIGLIIENKR